MRYTLLPLQHPIPIGDDEYEYYQFQINDDVYKMEKYPKNALINYEIENMGYAKVLHLYISPFVYYPTKQKYACFSKAVVDISLKNKTRDDVLVKDISMNELMNIKAEAQIRNNSFIDIGLLYYEYVVITNSQLSNSFQQFVNWKRAKGYNIGIVDIADILNNQYLVGDTISNINDNAGILRQYLMYSYRSVNTKYVLLGGGSGIIPTRYGTGNNNQGIPTDWYYCDLHGNWNSNGNNMYGERTGDTVGKIPDVFVGRIMCESGDEVKKWTKKLLRYEINPGNGDYSYLTKSLFTESDELQYGNEALQVKNQLSNFQTTIISEYPSHDYSLPTSPKGSDIINLINNNHYGLLSNFNHGGQSKYNIVTPGINGYINNVWQPPLNSYYNIYALESYGIGDYYAREDSLNGFDNLTNDKYPSVFYSVSCKNMPFDDLDGNGLRNLGEAFTCISKGGGPAYLGNTRTGYVDYSSQVYKKFIQQIVANMHIGEAEALSKQFFIDSTNTYHHISLAHNLLGCPEMPMWTATPITFNNISIQYINGVLVINTNGISGCRIAISSAVDFGLSYFEKVENVSSTTFTNVPEKYIVVITKSNYIPYIYSSIGFCFIQDETIETEVNINGCENVQIGCDVNDLYPYGDVEIKDGGKLNISNSNEVVIKNNFSVELGGELLIE